MKIQSPALFVAALLLSLNATILMANDFGKGKRAFADEDYKTAFKELKPLIKEGNLDAISMVGYMYANGLGVDKDIKQARTLFEKGAAQGHIDSIDNLRILENNKYAVELESVKKAAESGDKKAQNRLGEMAEFGQGMERDLEQAFEWYKKSADQGWVAAYYNLGRCYNFGTGVEQNFSEAEHWYRKAATDGYSNAMFFLGTLYSVNQGSTTEGNNSPDIEAYAWMHNAAKLGNATAQDFEKRLAMKLKPEELATAKALADQYYNIYAK